MRITMFLALFVACTLALPPAVLAGSAGDAANAFAKGESLLAQANFDAALSAFKNAVKADPENQDYAQQYAMLRQVVRMRSELPKQDSADDWLKSAAALRAYYLDHKLHSEALQLDRERHRRFPSGESAIQLARTQLEVGLNSETVSLIEALKPEDASQHTQVLRGLALARQGRVKDAKDVVTALGAPDEKSGPEFLFDLARLCAVTGGTDPAIASLITAFELTPPSKLEALKTDASDCKDMVALQDSSEWQAAMKTASKVKESDCSKGTSCGKCPSRSKCGSKE